MTCFEFTGDVELIIPVELIESNIELPGLSGEQQGIINHLRVTRDDIRVTEEVDLSLIRSEAVVTTLSAIGTFTDYYPTIEVGSIPFLDTIYVLTSVWTPRVEPGDYCYSPQLAHQIWNVYPSLGTV